MFGLGLSEIVVLVMLGGGAVVVALVVWMVSRSGTGRVAELEEDETAAAEGTRPPGRRVSDPPGCGKLGGPGEPRAAVVSGSVPR